MLLGILSDTHGLLRPEALAALREARVDHILHAGDVGNIEILETLRTLAPVTAIRGNIDLYGPCADLPATELVELDGLFFYLIHSIHDLDIDPIAAGVHAILSGHSHQPHIEHRNGVLHLNPGSTGPRRFNLPVTLALLETSQHPLTPRLLQLL